MLSTSLAASATLSGVKPNLVMTSLSGAELPKVCIPIERPPKPDVAIPAQRRGLLDRDPGAERRWQHLVAVGGVLAIEDLPAGEADDPRADPFAAQLLVGIERQRDLAAGRDQDHLGIALSAGRRARSRRAAAPPRRRSASGRAPARPGG